MRPALACGLTLGLLVGVWFLFGFHEVTSPRSPVLKPIAVAGIVTCLAIIAVAATLRVAKRAQKQLFSSIDFSPPPPPAPVRAAWPLFNALAASLSPANRTAASDLMSGVTGREVLALYRVDSSYRQAQTFVTRLAGRNSGLRVAAFATPPGGGAVYIRGWFDEADLVDTLNTLKRGCERVEIN